MGAVEGPLESQGSRPKPYVCATVAVDSCY
jgi:hypothetical protein